VQFNIHTNVYPKCIGRNLQFLNWVQFDVARKITTRLRTTIFFVFLLEKESTILSYVYDDKPFFISHYLLNNTFIKYICRCNFSFFFYLYE